MTGSRSASSQTTFSPNGPEGRGDKGLEDLQWFMENDLLRKEQDHEHMMGLGQWRRSEAGLDISDRCCQNNSQPD